jgi:hypothetical protein
VDEVMSVVNTQFEKILADNNTIRSAGCYGNEGGP